MEDRFCAIRAAIGTAQARDVVIIAGKGAQDYMEYGDGEGGVIKVRCRHWRLVSGADSSYMR